ncbi:hypothetical protein [Lysinibacillus fusiformis]|uniref:Uncharacterized protein n=1 Tax=Lysinibacillus fusiformis TaxID=28031 RepID=A0A1H9KYB6_9BACI|nr:hypothetical protein [Lysinibacillus fusiformis]SCY52691.1 hypothetical protein SAMN02787081_02869 [Lysinibacillus fusiformis]SEN93550.1 hypothetical protein SAMN02787103_02988 [Lysinibacillus fusiformis]SER04194.1 hypothetical protein SAMN02787113_02881 [Lysinibacillus fusiformis]
MNFQHVNFKNKPISILATEMDLLTFADNHPEDLEEDYGLSIDVILQIIHGLIPDITL